LNLSECRDLSFLEPDTARFPALQIAYEACRLGGCKPAVLNAANEVAVAAFLEGKIKFPEIARVVEKTVENGDLSDDTNIHTILEADRFARIESAAIVQRLAES
jgi:1-deoxy-D-xylulose-5-phosphate reductoisomerase